MTNDLKYFNKSLGFGKRKIVPSNDHMKYFSSSLGFDKHKQTAVDLLKITIEILDEFNIEYFLISGTLLGYVRHNDFIPYDDDMDLIVSSDIKKQLPLISKKYKHKITMISNDYLVKFCFKDKVYNLNSYFWPFMDLFIFEYTNNNKSINFFCKDWDIEEFFPKQKIEFNSVLVSIPKNPDYFLSRNYGKDYMTVLKSSNWNHKKECPIYQQYYITIEEFNKYKEKE